MSNGLYRSKLIRSIVGLEMIAACIAVISSFFVVFNTLANRLILSGDIKVKAMYRQTENAEKGMETSMRFIAGNDAINNLTAELDGADAQTALPVARQLSARLKDALAFCPNIEQAIILAHSSLITQESVIELTQPANKLLWKNDDAKRHDALSTAASLLGCDASLLTEHTAFTSTLPNGAMLIGLMKKGGVFGGLSSVPLFAVMDEKNEFIFSTIETAGVQQAIQGRADLFADSLRVSDWGGRLLRADAGLFFWNGYYDSVSGLTYLQLKPVAELLGSLQRPCLIHLSMCLLLALLLHATVLRMVIGWCLGAFTDLRGLILDDGQKKESPLLSDRLGKNVLFRRRLLLTCLTATLPLLLTILLVRPIYSEAVLLQIKADSREDLAQTALLMKQRMAESLQFARKLATDGRILSFLSDGFASEYVEKALLTNDILISNVHMVRLYDADGRPLFSSGSDQPSALPEAKRLARPYGVDMDAADSSQCSLVIPVCGEGASGYVEVGFSMADYLATGLLEDESGYRYLFDRSKWRLVGAPAKSAHKTLAEGVAQGKMLHTAENSDGYFVNIYSDPLRKTTRSLMFVNRELAGADWILIHAIEVTPLLEAANVSMNVLIMAAACTILLIFAFITLFTHALFKPLRKLEMYFLLAKPNTRQNAFDGSDEFALIANAYQDAITRTQQLNARLVASAQEYAKLERRKRQTEMIALQSQLDSHLISNIFASMKILLREGKRQELREIIDATARFLRGGLSIIENDVPFWQECQHLKAYMVIQQFRFRDRIAFSIHADDPSLKRCSVPRLMLQPVVENAVHHGMSVNRRLSIRVEAFREGDDVQIIISNNGNLPDEETCRLINERLLEKDQESDHIGLRNLQERISLRYGAAYGISLSADRQTHITKVMIRLPYTVAGGEDAPHV